MVVASGGRRAAGAGNGVPQGGNQGPVPCCHLV